MDFSFEIRGFSFPVYSVMGALGLVSAALYLVLGDKKTRVSLAAREDWLYIGILGFTGAFAGSKLLFALTALPVVIENGSAFSGRPLFLLEAMTGGGVFYGGLLGGMAAVFGYCRRYRLCFSDISGFLAPAIPLFHFFGRIGCFLAGCCWGKSFSWGVCYPNAQGGAPAGQVLFPVQLVEALFNLLLFFVLWRLSRRIARRLLFPLYLAAYSVFRFFAEFFRGDAYRGVWLLSTSQWISLGICAVLAGRAFAGHARRADRNT